MCLQVPSLSPGRNGRQILKFSFFQRKGSAFLSQQVTFPLLGIQRVLGRTAVTCQRHTKREEGRFWSPAKYCTLLRTEALPHALGGGYWCASVQVVTTSYLHAWEILALSPPLKALRVFGFDCYSHIDTIDLEKFLRTAKKTKLKQLRAA